MDEMQFKKLGDYIADIMSRQGQSNKKENSGIFMDFKERLIRLEEHHNSSVENINLKLDGLISRADMQNGNVAKNVEKIRKLEDWRITIMTIVGTVSAIGGFVISNLFQ